MSLSTGIIGLPNIGKSSLFSAITNSQVEIANYAFATIEPNTGIVNLNDDRLKKLSKIISSEKTTYATCKFVDIAGLVKGASKGEGLGNKFLTNIKDVDAICHVLRCFNDSEIMHVSEDIDPIYDLQVINLELIYSDLDLVNSKIDKIKNKASSGDKESKILLNLFFKLKNCLIEGKMLNKLSFTQDEHHLIKPFSFLTIKPIIYVANVNDDEFTNPNQNKHYKKLVDFLKGENLIAVSIKMELEISRLSKNQKEAFKNDFKIIKSGLDLIVEKTYEILNLATYFTFGKKEVRAWTYKKGMNAKECAGIIHSDFEKGFIRAEVYNYSDIIEFKDQNKLKEIGKVKIVGKDYLVKDGEIYHFRFSL